MTNDSNAQHRVLPSCRERHPISPRWCVQKGAHEEHVTWTGERWTVSTYLVESPMSNQSRAEGEAGK